MNKFHVSVLALLFAGAAVLGAVAVTRTTHLGSAARQANDTAFQARAKQLTSYAAQLRKELKAHPPALPALPKRAPAAPVAAAAQAPRVVYQQPPPVVVTVHKHHDDGSDGGEDGGGGGND